MYNSVIYLLDEMRDVDEYGDMVVTCVERPVYAELKSIGQSEFYQAQAVGLKPEIKFVIADYLDYHNEQRLKFQPYGAAFPEYYSVIRTYVAGTELELVCKKGID